MADDDGAFWSQRDAAREYTRLAHACEALFAALGSLAPRLAEPAAANAAATLARRLGEAAPQWSALVPESVLLGDARAEGALEPIVVDAEPAPVVEALGALSRDLHALLDVTTEVADASARRLAARLVADVDAAQPSLQVATPHPGG
jgi:hypothetical protein